MAILVAVIGGLVSFAWLLPGPCENFNNYPSSKRRCTLNEQAKVCSALM